MQNQPGCGTWIAMEMLPEEVVSLILLWLPVATLLRFKSVCKSWYSLIKSPNFINQHCNHHHLENLVVVYPPLRMYEPHKLALCSASGHLFEIFEPPLPADKLTQITLNTSYNGVICLRVYLSTGSVFCLYNPTLKEFRILPEPAAPDFSPETTYFRVHGGFGFDRIHNDYMVVRVAAEVIRRSDTIKTTHVHVYSLTTGCWTTVDAVVPAFIREQAYSTPTHNGRYHFWLAFMGTHVGVVPPRLTLLSFDFSKQVFGTIPAPDISPTFLPDLVLFHNKISCIEKVFHIDKPVCNVWLLNEYGVDDSWTKVYTICIENFAVPKVFLNNGDIICHRDDIYDSDTTTLYLRDHVTKEMKILLGQLDSFVTFQLASYKESLLSVKAPTTICNL